MTSNFKTFLEYYREKEVKLIESPQRIGRNYGEDLDNMMFNVENAKNVVESYPHIINQTPLSVELGLYRDVYVTGRFMDYWITKQPFISCYYMFQSVPENGIQSLGVWNDMRHKGSARELLFSYYLKNYSFVISDKQHSTQGEAFWKKIIDSATKEGYTVTVITRDDKEFDIDDMNAYWGNTSSFSEYRIKIYKKQL